MQSQKLCLKWNNHTPNLLSVLGSFQQKELLVDVTISCEGHNLKAHKIVLSACSPYFQEIFLNNPCKHPIIFMNGMKFEDITAILNFMYKGEVNVSHDGLSSFLQAAEALKVKGLAEVCGEKNSTNSISQEVQQSEQSRPPRTDTPPRKRQRNRKRSLSDSNRSDDEGSTRKHREPSSPEVHELSGDESLTGDNSSNGTPFNSMPRVPQKAFSRSHQPSSNLGDEDDYEMDADKLLEQNMATETTSMNNSTDNNLRIERIMGNATEMESSSLQEPESPPDIKPIINFGESSTGASEGALMSYNEQSQFSQPGPSSAQDSTLLHDSSHPTGKLKQNELKKQYLLKKQNELKKSSPIILIPHNLVKLMDGVKVASTENDIIFGNKESKQIDDVVASPPTAVATHCHNDFSSVENFEIPYHKFPEIIEQEENVDGEDFSSITNEDLKELELNRERMMGIIASEAGISASPVSTVYCKTESLPSVEVEEGVNSTQIIVPVVVQQNDQAYTSSQPSRYCYTLDLRYTKPETIPVLDAVRASERGKKILKNLECGKMLTQNDIREIVRLVLTLATSDLQTMYPSPQQKTNIAKALVMAIPQLKNTRDGCEGYEQFFDPNLKVGMIEWRLKTMRISLDPSKKKYSIRRKQSTKRKQSTFKDDVGGGGGGDDDDDDDDHMEDKINWLKYQETTDQNKAEIFKTMADTLKVRRKFINRQAPTITDTLQMYPKFKEFKGELIDVEFCKLYPDAGSFLEKFASHYSPRIWKYCRETRLDIFERYDDILDEKLAACLMLADLLYGSGARRKILSENKEKFPSEHLVRFSGENADFAEVLNKKSVGPQPSLICQGGRKTTDLKFFLILDTTVVDVGACSIRSIDILYKTHYVFNVQYNKVAERFFLFLDFMLYGLKKGPAPSSIENLNLLLSRINV